MISQAQGLGPIPQPTPIPAPAAAPVAAILQQSVRVPALTQRIRQATAQTLPALLGQVEVELASITSKKAIELLAKELSQLCIENPAVQIIEQTQRIQAKITQRVAHSEFSAAIACRGAAQTAARRAELRYEPHRARVEVLNKKIEKLSEDVTKITKKLRALPPIRSMGSYVTNGPRFLQLQREKAHIEKEIARRKKNIEQLILTRFGNSLNIVALDWHASVAIKEGNPIAETLAASLADLLHISAVIHVAVAATVKVPVKVPATEKTNERIIPQIHGVAQSFLHHAVPLNQFTYAPNLNIQRELHSRIDPESYQKNALFATLNAAWDIHRSNIMLCIVPNEAYNRCIGKMWAYKKEAANAYSGVDSFDDLIFKYIEGQITNATKIREVVLNQSGVYIAIDPTRTIAQDNELQEAIHVKLELKQFDNERLLNLGRGAWHEENPNAYQLWHKEVILPTRLCILGLLNSLDPLLPEVRDTIRALSGRRAAVKEYTTRGDPSIWQHFSPALQQELQDYFVSSSYKHYDPHNLNGRTWMLNHLPEALFDKVYNALQAGWLDAPNLPDVATFMKQQIEKVRERLLQLQSTLAFQEKAKEAYEIAARVLIRNLHNYMRADKKNYAYFEEAMQDFKTLWQITHEENALPNRAVELLADIEKAIQAMDQHVKISVPLRNFKRQLAHLRSNGSKPLLECRNTIKMASDYSQKLEQQTDAIIAEEEAESKMFSLNAVDIAMLCVRNTNLPQPLQQQLEQEANQCRESLLEFPNSDLASDFLHKVSETLQNAYKSEFNNLRLSNSEITKSLVGYTEGIIVCNKYSKTLKQQLSQITSKCDAELQATLLRVLEKVMLAVNKIGLPQDQLQKIQSAANLWRDDIAIHTNLSMITFLDDVSRFLENTVLPTLRSKILPKSIATKLFPSIAPKEAAALDERMAQAVEYLTMCEEAVKACSHTRELVEANMSHPTWTAANRNAVVTALTKIVKQLDTKGIALDVRERLWQEGVALVNALPAASAAVEPVKKAALLQYLTQLSQVFEPTSLGMHFILFPKVKKMIDILVNVRVITYCRNQQLQIPTRDHPFVDPALYVKLRNEIFLEQHHYYKVEPGVDPKHPQGVFYSGGSFAFFPCKKIIECGKTNGNLSDAEYQSELAYIKEIESTARFK